LFALLPAVACAVLVAGCGSPPDIRTEPIPPELMAMVSKAAPADQGGLLLAVATFQQAGLLDHYTFTRPTAGTEPVYYQAQIAFDVADTSAWVLTLGKANRTMRVRAINAEGRSGPWLALSDTAGQGGLLFDVTPTGRLF